MVSGLVAGLAGWLVDANIYIWAFRITKFTPKHQQPNDCRMNQIEQKLGLWCSNAQHFADESTFKSSKWMVKLARDQIVQCWRGKNQQQQHPNMNRKTFMSSPDFHGFSIIQPNQVNITQLDAYCLMSHSQENKKKNAKCKQAWFQRFSRDKSIEDMFQMGYGEKNNYPAIQRFICSTNF